MKMKTQSIGYWVTTGLLATVLLAGGVADLVHAPPVASVMAHLGYPAYFLSILGVWKTLGALALVAPRAPLIKEWAYAGVVFDLTGAAASHAVAGDSADNIAVPLVLLALAAASWALRPSSRTLVPLRSWSLSARARPAPAEQVFP